MRLIIQAALAVLILMFAGQADQAQAAEPSNRLTLPFDPPIGETLRYKVVKSTISLDNPVPDSELLEEVTFLSGSNGILLNLKTIHVREGDRTYTQDDPFNLVGRDIYIPNRTNDIIRLTTNPSFELLPNGTILTPHDWDGLRESLRNVPDAVLKNAPPTEGRNVLHQRMSGNIAPLLALDPPSAATMLSNEWLPMLGFAGQRFELGKEKVSIVAQFLYGKVLTASNSATLSQRDDGALHLKIVQAPDSEGFAQARSAHYTALIAAASPDLVERYRAEYMRLRGTERVNIIEIFFDDRGLMKEGYWETRDVRGDEVVTSEKVTFEQAE